MKKLLLVLILLFIFYYLGFLQGKDKNFMSEYIKKTSSNKFIKSTIDEIKKIPSKIP